MPLSKQPRRGQQSSRRVLLILVTMFGTMGMMGVAWVASTLGWFWPFVAVELAASVAVYLWLLRRIRERPMLAMAS